MKMYIEMFKNIDLRPCELVAIREIAGISETAPVEVSCIRRERVTAIYRNMGNL